MGRFTSWKQTASDKKKSIREDIKIIKYRILYFQRLLSTEPTRGGCDPTSFVERSANLQTKIDELLDDQKSLQAEYDFAEIHIAELEHQLKTLEEKHGVVVEEITHRKERLKKADSLRERLKILEQELRDADFDICNLDDILEEFTEELNEQT